MQVQYALSLCFNSRSREGATVDMPEQRYFVRVSIHAPVRERQNRSTNFLRY